MDEKFTLSLINAIDSFEPSRFGQFLSEDVEFRFGNLPTVKGRVATEAAVAAFFDQIRSIKHHLVRVMRCDDVLVAEMQCHYVDNWERALNVPVCNLMTVRNGKISDYRIFIDNSALFVPPADAA